MTLPYQLTEEEWNLLRQFAEEGADDREQLLATETDYSEEDRASSVKAIGDLRALIRRQEGFGE